MDRTERTGGRTNSRERRVVAWGAVIVVTSLVITYGVVPFARRWSARETEIVAAEQRVQYLQDLVARAPRLETSASALEASLSVSPRRALHARSTALGASALQSMLADAADASHVVVTRLDVSSDSAAVAAASSGSDSSVPRIPATLSVYGDIEGVSAMLDLLLHGPRVLSVEKLTLLRNSALAGAPDVVQLTVQLSAPVLPP